MVKIPRSSVVFFNTHKITPRLLSPPSPPHLHAITLCRNARANLGQIQVYPGGDETPKPTRVIAKARWGKDPNTVLTGSADGFLRVWDLRTREKVRKVQVAGAVMDLEMSWDKKIATVAAGDVVHFLDTGVVMPFEKMEIEKLVSKYTCSEVILGVKWRNERTRPICPRGVLL